MDTIHINCGPNEYEAARKKMKSALLEQGVDVEKYNTQIGLVQKYELIENGKLSLKFDLKNKANGINSESVIVENDVFIPFGIALGFVKTPIISDNKFESIENQQIIYFNSETVFNYIKPDSVSQAKALESLYYSQISIATGGDTLVPSFPTRLLKRIPKNKIEGLYNYENGVFHMLTEYPFLNGGNTNVIKFDVPSADTASASGNVDEEKTYAVLQLIGYNIIDLAKESAGSQIKCV